MGWARRLLAAISLLAVAAGCAGLSGTRGAVQRTVKVALVDAFSGSGEAAGQAVRNGLQVGVDALNAHGGLLGDRVEVVAADGERSPAKLNELLREQLGDPAVQLLVGPNGPTGFQAVRATIGQAGLPSCLTAAPDDALAGARSTFRVAPSDRTRVAALLGYLRQAKPDLRRLALLGGDDAQPLDRVLAAEATQRGMTYVGRVGAGDADPTPALQQVAATGVQVVVVADGRQGAAVAAAAAVRQLGLAGRLTLAGFDGLAAYGFPTLGGDPAQGAVVATTNHAYLAGGGEGSWPAAYRAFVGTAQREFGTATNGIELQADPAAADCVLQWARAVRQAGTFRGADVVRAWERVYVPAAEAALGVTERPTGADHTAVGPDGVFLYTWARDGARYRLKPL